MHTIIDTVQILKRLFRKWLYRFWKCVKVHTAQPAIAKEFMYWQCPFCRLVCSAVHILDSVQIFFHDAMLVTRWGRMCFLQAQEGTKYFTAVSNIANIFAADKTVCIYCIYRITWEPIPNNDVTNSTHWLSDSTGGS